MALCISHHLQFHIPAVLNVECDYPNQEEDLSFSQPFDNIADCAHLPHLLTLSLTLNGSRPGSTSRASITRLLSTSPGLHDLRLDLIPFIGPSTHPVPLLDLVSLSICPRLLSLLYGPSITSLHLHIFDKSDLPVDHWPFPPSIAKLHISVWTQFDDLCNIWPSYVRSIEHFSLDTFNYTPTIDVSVPRGTSFLFLRC